jgi:FtsP/CotA-like multicopper oxidase with cupredoxin domain
VRSETQDPIPIGGEYTYRLRLPDAGLYRYHPHIREDYGLAMGLYDNIVVVPADDDYWAPVNREEPFWPDARRDGSLRQRHADRRRSETRARRARG